MTSDLNWWLMSPVTVISYYVWAYVCGIILWAVCTFLMSRKSCYFSKNISSREKISGAYRLGDTGYRKCKVLNS